MGLYKRGDIWWVSIKRKHYQYVGSTGCDQKEDAEIVLQSKLQEARAARHGVLTETKDPLFVSFVTEHYIPTKKDTPAWRNNQYYVADFLKRFQSKRMSQISPLDIRNFVSELKAQGMSAASINRNIINILSNIYRYAAKLKEFTGENPLASVDREKVAKNKRIRFLEKEEFLTLMQLATPILKDIMLFAVATGLRVSEIQRVNLKDVDFKRNILYLDRSKNGDEGVPIYLNKISRAVLEKQTENMPFAFNWRRRWEKVIKVSDINKGLTNSTQDRRKKVTFHTLRHTFGSWLAGAGVDRFKIKEVGRWHSDEVDRYTHLAPTHGLQATDIIATILLQNEKALSVEAEATTPNAQ